MQVPSAAIWKYMHVFRYHSTLTRSQRPGGDAYSQTMAAKYMITSVVFYLWVPAELRQYNKHD